MIRCALALSLRPLTSTPRARRSSISAVRTAGSTTTPLPMTHVRPGYRIPDGMRWNFHVSPAWMIVWPALLPPWKRTTTSACSARRSMTLPLPSSPHWAPTITVPGISCESVGGATPRRVPAGPDPAHSGGALEAQEPRVLTLEGERHVAEAAVAVLGDDEVGLARAVGVLVVVLVAVDEHDEVGVLLDLAGLAQVGEHRALVGARLDAARQLRQRDDGDLELAREDLQAAGDLADRLHAVVGARVGAQQLEVVDDDHAQAAVLAHRLLVQAPRLGPDLEDADVRRVVDVQRRAVVARGGLQDALPLA